mmetsp:Transcript_129416/g.414807  ORF Transcript_129416/g.414807 Transcript_129416/m.414807 type:complete len:345 (-) Transcript_129416:1472-2506(-)
MGVCCARGLESESVRRHRPPKLGADWRLLAARLVHGCLGVCEDPLPKCASVRYGGCCCCGEAQRVRGPELGKHVVGFWACVAFARAAVRVLYADVYQEHENSRAGGDLDGALGMRLRGLHDRRRHPDVRGRRRPRGAPGTQAGGAAADQHRLVLRSSWLQEPGLVCDRQQGGRWQVAAARALGDQPARLGLRLPGPAHRGAHGPRRRLPAPRAARARGRRGGAEAGAPGRAAGFERGLGLRDARLPRRGPLCVAWHVHHRLRCLAELRRPEHRLPHLGARPPPGAAPGTHAAGVRGGARAGPRGLRPQAPLHVALGHGAPGRAAPRLLGRRRRAGAGHLCVALG